MKFEIDIKEEDFEKLKNFLIDMDCEVEDKKDIIKELFFLEDRQGELFDLRDEVIVKSIK